MLERTTAYHCTEGSSDKVYFLTLRGDDASGYRVLTQYGPRGGRMTSGEKTSAPTTLDLAEKAFAKEHKARLAKGYCVTGGEVPEQLSAASNKVDSGLRPQLLNPVTPSQAEALILDPDFVMQVKRDGERTLIRANRHRIEAINRKGQLTSLPMEIATAIAQLPLTDADTVLDGERLVGGIYAPFDLLQLDGVDLQTRSTEERVAALLTLVGDGGVPPALAKLRQARTTAEKRQLLAESKANGEEGVVFKRASAPYVSGRPASGGDQFKLKFWETASVRVESINPTKRSVGMEARDNASGLWHFVGNVTVPTNHSVPSVGTIIEVRYLYYFGVGGALFEPSLHAVRTDLDEVDCSLSQLKLKGEPGAAPQRAA